MTLVSGTRLGPYEILAPLGAGGMGEVYRAKDTRLDRTVAIKVLPAHLSQNPEFRQRFEREAKTISSLSHPHICALHDIGHQDGTDFLVMEFLEGETLTDRLAKGPLPLEQALRYGIEMADALDKAHRQGVIHRDLKPGNIMLTKSGVKLVDFGLAKFTAPGAARLSSATALPTQAPDLTAEGTILGTFQYMAPEQLEGKEADARTDIFALGAVLYEMATGQKAFSGRSQASLIAAILHTQPATISSVQPMSPPALDRVVKTCLAKDPEDRWRTAHDIGVQLRWIAEGGSQAGMPAPVVARRKSRERLAWAVAAAGVLAALGAGLVAVRSSMRAPAADRTVRASVIPPENWFFIPFGSLALSPDGSRLAFIASTADGKLLLWVRSLDAGAAQSLPGTEDAFFPFWSPDSRFIGFFAGGKLKKIEASGGPIQTVCDAQLGSVATWNRQGVILFHPGPNQPIYRVSAEGGQATPVTKLDASKREIHHTWPHFLPDGRHFLYVAHSPGGANGLFVGSLDSKETRLLMRDASNASYAEPGYLLFARQANLLAQPFDAKRLRVSGDPVLIARQVSFAKAEVLADFSVSQNGILAYRSGATLPSQLVWYDREGDPKSSIGEPTNFWHPRLSPDGKQIAVVRADPQSGDGDIWLYESTRGEATRFTFNPALYAVPVWSPAGDRLLFSSNRSGYGDLYEKGISGSGDEKVFLASDFGEMTDDWSLDGRLIAYDRVDPKSGMDIWLYPLSGERKPFPLVQTPFWDWGGRFSPNGDWIAYTSGESGKNEVYVRPVSGSGGKWRVSTAGGLFPRWRRDGKELFYLAPDGKMMSVEVKKSAATFEMGIPRPLFRLPQGSSYVYFERIDYDVSADGQRFLINVPVGEQASLPINLILNWTAGLKK